MRNFVTKFSWIFKFGKVQKRVNLVDLVKSLRASIRLQKSASIKPRTSPSKFGGNFNSSFIRLLTRQDAAEQRLARQINATREAEQRVAVLH